MALPRLTRRGKLVRTSAAITAFSTAASAYVITQVNNGVEAALDERKIMNAFATSDYLEQQSGQQAAVKAPRPQLKAADVAPAGFKAVTVKAPAPKAARPKATTPKATVRNYEPLDVARVAYQAGFRGESLITIVAISRAENTYGELDCRGDEHLVGPKWYISNGLVQMRNLHEETGTGGTRDEVANRDPQHNLRSAFKESRGGTYFKPWTTFVSGAYKEHLGIARQAVIDYMTELRGGVPTTAPINAGKTSELCR